MNSSPNRVFGALRIPTAVTVVAFALFVVLDGLLILVYAPLSTFATGDCGAAAYCDYPSAIWVLYVVEGGAICLLIAVPVLCVTLAKRGKPFASVVPLLGIVATIVLFVGLQLAAQAGSQKP